MRRLLCVSSTLFGVLSLATSIALLIGHAHPIPEQLGLLHLGDMCELPCWIGIIPGKTHVSTARLIIAKVFNQGVPLTFDTLHGATHITTPDGLGLWISLNGFYPGELPDDASRVVSSISLSIYPGNGTIPLGYIIGSVANLDGVQMGYACCAGVALVKQRIRISLLNASVAEFSPRHIYPAQSVGVITLFADYHEQYDMPWHGFGFYQKVFPLQAP